MNRQRAQAFTLVELLVVMSIISLLIAMLLPSLGQARDSARSSLCLNNLKSQVMALNYYTADYKDFVPPLTVNYPNPMLGKGASLYQNYQSFWSGQMPDNIFLGKYSENTDVHSGLVEYASNGQIPRRGGAWWCPAFNGAVGAAAIYSSYSASQQGYIGIAAADTAWAGLYKLSNIAHPSKMLFISDSSQLGYFIGFGGAYNFYRQTDEAAEKTPVNFSAGSAGYVYNGRIRHASLTASNYSFPDGHAGTIIDPKGLYATRNIVVKYTE